MAYEIERVNLPTPWILTVNDDEYCTRLFAALTLIENYTRNGPGLASMTDEEAQDYTRQYARILLKKGPLMDSQDFAAAAELYPSAKRFFPTSPDEFAEFVGIARAERLDATPALPRPQGEPMTPEQKTELEAELDRMGSKLMKDMKEHRAGRSDPDALRDVEQEKLIQAQIVAAKRNARAMDGQE